MRKLYNAPLTEIVYISTENILEGEGGTMDSTGDYPPGDVDANSSSFDEGEFSGAKSLWDD